MSPIRELPDADPLLVVIPNVGMSIQEGLVFMDIKAVEGLALYARNWPGSVRCIARAADPASIVYGRWYRLEGLPFEVVVVDRGAGAAEIMQYASEAAIILAGADNHLDLDLTNGNWNIPVVLAIELTLRTRLDILRLSSSRMLQKIKTALWLVLIERKRRRALASALGLQANGMPSFRAYSGKNAASILYFDTRLRASDFIGMEGASQKAAALAKRSPLRLAFSGRLEALKGAEDLIAVMTALRRRGKVQCHLNIYGQGSLRAIMHKQIREEGLSDWVSLNDPIEFEQELVPLFKSHVDLFLCCHPQDDPSCTYLETLGCGVPIVGYSNRAFKGILSLGPCGVGVPVRDVEAMACAIEQLNEDRSMLATLTCGAAEVASTRLFEVTFAKRIAHLRALASV